VNILFIGDIVGRPGRDLVRAGLDALVRQHQVDFVIANAENAAGGFGVTREIGDELLGLGVDVMTSGNHIWDKKEAIGYIGVEARLLRPANYPAGVPGRGSYVGRTRDGRAVGVVNAMGRVFMLNIDDPFTTAVREIESVRERTPLVVVDFHAEATSEKIAMGWHLAGKVTAIVGTHTHVQTADNRILPGGTAYITDVGMTGPHDGIIGVEREPALARFLNAMPARFDTASGDLRLHAVVIAADAETGRASAITRLSLSLADLHALSAPTYDEAGTPGAR
jgi:2',3'-cyclic-nucleotide 2'-phosphodiesterase